MKGRCRIKRADCRLIDLDEYVDNITGHGDKPPHADYALICGDRVIIVEEVDGKAELRDGKKVEVSEGLLRKRGEITSAMCVHKVVHARGGADPMVARVFRSAKIFLVTCCDKLSEVVQGK
ncbi:hypothetical protein [Vulcanisaeta souniana]|uniref:Uncharacterized protein n=1 Tax=Vulcanisaeta souniana JCM 11219 TaxID=1293586 RepID=A0A830DZS4_9CREN|nr:hypothetical protein [Vulcanisaeta souniana]BDR91388.1 hypothetical protein Vsou_04810 [Vulcanisaeta souniana JCM 11219]GGI72797.1 hypothetical protein GCM10007112_07030 [Vulcanisaeta souniana JCM 11219]